MINTLMQRAYRIPEAAAQVGMSRSRIYELIADGELPVIKVGRTTVISAKALDDLMGRLESGELVIRS